MIDVRGEVEKSLISNRKEGKRSRLRVGGKST